MDELIGKKGYKKTGFFAGVVGTIERSDLALYRIVFSNGSSVGARKEDIELVEDETNQQKGR